MTRTVAMRLPEPVRRLLWFAALYVAGVLTVGVVAYGLRAILFAR